MTEDIETILSEECGLVKDRPIIVGVSGGPDSLCLMETLRQAGYSVLVAHFDHQLRPESVDEARVVAQMAARFNLQFESAAADVRAHAGQAKLSLEEAARDMRYQFLFRLAREHHAQAVAVGHTADDQVETILMHFMRGSALNGLKGMPYRSILKTFDPHIPIVRPLLDLWRADTIAYCAAHDLQPHYDSSNASTDYQRNHIRHLLIPSLEGYNPKFRAAVLRMSHSLKDDHVLLMELLENAWRETVLEVGADSVAFDASLLTRCSPGLQRNLVKHAMQTLSPAVDVSHAALARAAALIREPAHQPARVDLKRGLVLFREADRIYVSQLDAQFPSHLAPQMTAAPLIPLPIPGQVELAGGWVLTCETWSGTPASARAQAGDNSDPYQAWLDADNLTEPLHLRARRLGDQFTPFGMDGHSQKLSDFFVNVKMPQRARDQYPLLCAGNEIIWVPGYRPAQSHCLTESTQTVLHLTLRTASS